MSEKHTKDILADELSKAGLFEMAAKARTGWYHDFLSPLATPCLQLAQDLASVELVNHNKQVEELCLLALDRLADHPDVDKRWLAIGRTAIENGWMAVNRSVFKPARATLQAAKEP